MKWSFPSMMTAGPARIDPIAAAFISAAGLTDPTQITEINRLVVNGKAHRWLQNCLAIWPIIGGSAAAHKYNLLDPRDLDAAFRLTFNGSWTHSATGILPDASTAYAQTHLIPNTNLTLNDAHLAYYSRTAAAGSSTATDMGGVNVATNDFRIIIRRSTNAYLSIINSNTSQISGTLTDGSGLFMGTRISSTDHRFFRNGAQVGTTNVTANGASQPTFETYIGAVNNAGVVAQFGNKECAFASIGSGISAALAAVMYTDIQVYQTALGRQV